MPLEFDTNNEKLAKIRVFGAGGAGNNAINRMIEFGVKGADFIAINTDLQALYLSKASQKLQIGEKLTKGLGSGGDPETGRKAAEESKDDLEMLIDGADLIFIAAGLGGGTGTGAAPVIAELARSKGILTVAVVTKPFWFEGQPRAKAAEKGFEDLKSVVDSIITIPNDKLLETVGKGTPLLDAFKVADDVLRQGVQGIIDLICKPGLINLDFADITTVMSQRGIAHMGIGVGYGDNKTVEAVRQAIESPLLDTTIDGAKGILYNITGDPTMGLYEVQEAARLINEAADPDANVFFGACIDPTLEDEVRVTVIATGFGEPTVKEPIPTMINTHSSSRGNGASPFGTNTYKPAAPKAPSAAVKPNETVSVKPMTPEEDDDGATLNFPKKPASRVRENTVNMGSRGELDDPDIPAFIRKRPRRPRNDY